MSEEYQRGRNAAMDADYYHLEGSAADVLIEDERDNKDFMAGWNDYRSVKRGTD